MGEGVEGFGIQVGVGLFHARAEFQELSRGKDLEECGEVAGLTQKASLSFVL